MAEFKARPLHERAWLIPGVGDLGLPPGFLDDDEEDDDEGGDWACGPDPERKREPEPAPYEPCPCGSGRKYKWCCRDKDRKARG